MGQRIQKLVKRKKLYLPKYQVRAAQFWIENHDSPIILNRQLNQTKKHGIYERFWQNVNSILIQLIFILFFNLFK